MLLMFHFESHLYFLYLGPKEDHFILKTTLMGMPSKSK